jgi:membrane fusion protein, multidrug efflux system
MPFRALASLCVLAALASPVVEAAGDAPATDLPALPTFTVTASAVPSERMLDGTVEAVHQATLSAQTGGRIAAIDFDVDDRVPAGAVIVRIRSAEQVAGLTQAQAALKEATAREAEAQANYGRISDMYQRKVVARATFDEASTARDAAVARLAAAKAGLDAAREGVGYTEVRTPYAGVVTRKLTQVGESVAPGTPLMVVASLDALRVVAEVPQSVVAQVRKARQAVVYADGRRIEATGLTLYPSARPETGTFGIRVDLPRDPSGLAPGMYVKVGLVTGESDLLLVPGSAIIERSEMRAVYVVAADGRVSLRQVRLGRPRGDSIEILAGLAEGEDIAVNPAAAAARIRQQAAAHD